MEIRSQEEIDALLSSLAGEDAGALGNPAMGQGPDGARREDNRKATYGSYDFRRPDKFSKDQLRSLQMIHETFARHFATSLSAYLRVSTHVDLVSVEQIPYDEYMRSLTSSIINVFSMDPLDGQGIIELEFNVVFSMIDRLLGGPGNMVKAGKVLTEIEKALTESIVQRALKELKSAWESIQQFNPVHEALETQSQFVQVVPPNDIVVSVLFEVKFGELRGALSICIPYLVLKPVLSKLSAQRWFAAQCQGGGHAAVLARRLEKTHVTCVCRLGKAQINIRDLCALRVGDVLPLDRKCNEELELMIGERVKFRGKPAQAGRKVAVHINRVVREEPAAAA